MTPDTLQPARAALADKLRAAKVGQFSQRLADLAAPAIELIERGEGGLSKLGGRPDLPRNLDWPWRKSLSLQPVLEPFHTPQQLAFLGNDAPLSFVAQIDLAQTQPLPDFPDHGCCTCSTTIRFRVADPTPIASHSGCCGLPPAPLPRPLRLPPTFTNFQ